MCLKDTTRRPIFFHKLEHKSNAQADPHQCVSFAQQQINLNNVSQNIWRNLSMTIGPTRNSFMLSTKLFTLSSGCKKSTSVSP